MNRVPRLLLAVLASLVGLLVLVALVGWMLPEEHEASRTIRVAATRAQVWQAITDAPSFPEWRPEVIGVHDLGAGREGWVEEYATGELPLQVVSRDDPRRLVLKIVDPDLPFGGTWTFRLGEDGSACELTITENGEIRNPIFRFVAHFFLDPHTTIDQYLENLRTKFPG